MLSLYCHGILLVGENIASGNVFLSHELVLCACARIKHTENDEEETNVLFLLLFIDSTRIDN